MDFARMDYEVERCTRQCAATGRPLAEGEVFYSVLTRQGIDIRRADYSGLAWQGPPAEAMAWWKSKMPRATPGKARLAPGEVMLELFHAWADQPDKQQLRYCLTLLMVRRRVLRLEETSGAETSQETLVVSSTRDDSTYQVPVAMPPDEQVGAIQDELARLLYAGTG
jgi:hypothetical protein